MFVFIPEDYLSASSRTAAMPAFLDPFANDFVYVEKDVVTDASEVIGGYTLGVPKMQASRVANDVRSSKARCTIESTSIDSQMHSENIEPDLDGSSSPSPAGLSEADTEVESESIEDVNFALSEGADIPRPCSSAPAGVCIITADAAREIFLAKLKRTRSKKDGLAARLGEDFGISAKAVRDIWRLRTWTQATWPFWTPEDMRKHLKKGLCASCRNAELKSLSQACSACKNKVSHRRL